MLHRLAIRDFVIVDALEIELGAGLTVLSGETGAGKSILVDALQLALGGRGDAGVVREERAVPRSPPSSTARRRSPAWLAEAGFDGRADDNAGRLLLRRTIDAQGKSRAWVNGSARRRRSCARRAKRSSTSTASTPGRA
jgi:DNA repair protein RecN (Recombination protein N)